jgi:hypothetical protein
MAKNNEQTMEIQQQEDAPSEEMERTRSRRAFVPERISTRLRVRSSSWPTSLALTRRTWISPWKRMFSRSLLI